MRAHSEKLLVQYIYIYKKESTFCVRDDFVTICLSRYVRDRFYGQNIKSYCVKIPRLKSVIYLYIIWKYPSFTHVVNSCLKLQFPGIRHAE